MKVLIIGAGLVGSYTALAMRLEGHDVTVLEKRNSISTSKKKVGKSINLALSHRGIRALEKVYYAKSLMRITVPIHARMIHTEKKEKQQYDIFGKVRRKFY